MAKKKLLIVGAFPPSSKRIFGGIISSCRALLQSSLSEKVELTLVDSTQISNPPPVLIIKIILAIKRMVLFVIRFERVKPNAVLLFASAGGSLFEKGLMSHYARIRGARSLMFPRGGRILHYCDEIGLENLLARFALSKPDRIVCQGEQWQEFVVSKLKRSIEVAPLIRNWTATPQLLSIGANRVFSAEVLEIRMIFVGWMDRAKGVMDLLVAFSRLPTEVQLRLEIIGEGDVSEEARDYVVTHSLSERVIFRGWLAGDDLLDAYRSADIFVLPSWFEGLPNAMIEAMAARIAVIVSNVGNIPGVVVDDESGLLVPPKDLDALEMAMRRVLVDAELRKRLANSAYCVAGRQFGVELAVDKIIDVLDGLQEEQSSGSF